MSCAVEVLIKGQQLAQMVGRCYVLAGRNLMHNLLPLTESSSAIGSR